MNWANLSDILGIVGCMTQKMHARRRAFSVIAVFALMFSALFSWPTTAHAADDAFDITIERTSSTSTKVGVGDDVSFAIRVVNNTGRTVTAFPTASNLKGVLTTGSPNCRYANLGAGKEFTCTSATYTVTEADFERGTFVPHVAFVASSDRAGQQRLSDEQRIEGPVLTVQAEPVGFWDDAMEVTERIDGQAITLGAPGYGGFSCQRIPALASLNNGWILAAWDGRPGCGDSPNPNSILQRISKDGGKSWSAPEVIIAGKQTAPIEGYSDPSYVVDRETGKVFLFSVQSYDQGFHGSVVGVDPTNRNVAHAQVAVSEDNGETWSAPRTITADITSGLEDQIKSRFAASGEGIQLQYGEHAGRLVQQFTFKDVNNQMLAISVYSDDHGETWEHGEPFGLGMDENKVVELSNGDLMVNSRASDGTKARKVAISTDGGETYGPVTVDYSLIDPNNNASITRAFPDAEEGSAQSKVLLFTNAANTGARSNGTVRLSCDDGATWSASQVFEPGSMQYSTITALRDANGKVIPGRYGLLYEAGTSGIQIKYMQVSLDWLGVLQACAAGNGDVYRGTNVVDYTVTNYGDETLTDLIVTGESAPGVEWLGEAATIPALEPGESAVVSLPVHLGKLIGAGPFALPVVISDANGNTGSGSAVVDMILQDDEAAPQCVDGVALANESSLPRESSNEGPAKILDKDANSMWHTPYLSNSVPQTVDFAVPYSPELVTAYLAPRTVGVNGKIKEATLSYVADDGKVTQLSSVSEGEPTYDLSALSDLVPADTQTVTLRLEITQTYGTTPNKWVSIAEACFMATAGADPSFDETSVTPAEPVFDTDAGMYTIPEMANVIYTVNAEAVAAGTYEATPGQVTVVAQVVAPYVLAENATSEWTATFAEVVDPRPNPTPSGPVEPGADPTDPPNTGSEPEQGVQPEDQTPTDPVAIPGDTEQSNAESLARTGASIAWVALAAAVLVAGGLVLVRRRSA